MRAIFSMAIGMLLIFNSYANSEWILIEGSYITNNESHADKNSLQIDGEIATFWLKRNNPSRDRFGAMSNKYQIAINCKSRQMSLKWMVDYSEADNKGNVIFNGEAPQKWSPVIPDSRTWLWYKFACNQ